MKKTLLAACAATLALLAAPALAASPDCDAKAAEKKLAGAAKTSFLKKCEKDAMAGPGAAAASAGCAASASEKKLAGAAKTSFLKKCTADEKAAKGGAMKG